MPEYVWRSEDTLWELVLSFYHACSNLFVRLGDWCLYLQGHLAGLRVTLNRSFQFVFCIRDTILNGKTLISAVSTPLPANLSKSDFIKFLTLVGICPIRSLKFRALSKL